MDSAGIPWYSTGTVTVTQGSSNVAGVGTNWVNAGLKVGDIFTIDKSRLYQITAVNSNTSLSLQEAYQGATGSSQVYFVIRNFAGTMQAQIAAQVSELVNKYESYIDTELKQITGPAGPTSFPYRGTWTTGRTYNGLDVVQYGNQLYMALYGHTSTSANAPGASGTAWTPLTITASGDIITTVFSSYAGFHNSLYRGKSLGSEVSASQWDSIRTGTFNDIFLGDYWQIQNTYWRVASFNYFRNTGAGPIVSKNHVVIVPDQLLYKSKMNETDMTTGGYYGSKMYLSGLDVAKEKIKSCFGEEHILVYSDFLSNTVTDGVEVSGAWVDIDVALMTEQMVFGCLVHKSGVLNGTNIIVRQTAACKQLNLFSLAPEFIGSSGSACWLRDVATFNRFCHFYNGVPSLAPSSSNLGVRPVFAICG